MTTSAMTLVFDGALRAAQLAPLLFGLTALQPAQAQLPRPVMTPVAAAVTATAPTVAPTPAVLDPASLPAPLQLTASHIDVRVQGRQAVVRTVLTYRNDGAVPVEALYTVPLPALLAAPGEPVMTLAHLEEGEAEVEADGCGDLAYEVAQFAEAGEPLDLRYEHGSVLVQPGEEVTLTLLRPTELLVRDARHRLVLPLAFQRGGAFTPRFSADVTVVAPQPIRTLASATHGGEVSGLGEHNARLSIPEGRVYEGQFLAFDFELGEGMDTAALVSPHWGGEARARAVLASNR